GRGLLFLPSLAEHHASGWRLRRSVRAGRVLLERNQLLRPGLEHGSDHAPGLLGLVGSDRQSGVPRENVEKQLRVRRQLRWFEMGLSGTSGPGRGPVPLSSRTTLSGSSPNRSTLGRACPWCSKGRWGTGRKRTATSFRSRHNALPVRSRKVVPAQRQLSSSRCISAKVSVRRSGSTPSSLV